ncbi:hypothetical protein CRG98_018681 [Punica granatum]|uniref:G-patch domain-containing protein n=1 Tax=Punica granatum TaxID=22663 RepID=A0A2I0JXB8_PUNGR|nr:hypothetical protein CRG98_018681 [Punica granatum]
MLAKTSSFSDLIEAGKKLDMGIKLGRMEGPAGKGKGEPSRRTTPGAPSTGGRKGKETAVNVVNPGHPTAQPYSVNFTPAPSSTPGYTPPMGHYQPPHPAQPIYYSAPPASLPLTTSQPFVHHYTPAIQTSGFESSSSKHCEYHQGASRHTLDNCWRLRDEIQKKIDDNQLTFNAVKPPNVQSNPLPNHRSSVGPSINMISICALREDEGALDHPPPFVINYVPEEPTVDFARNDTSPAPFVIDIPTSEPYSNNKGKAPATEVEVASEAAPIPPKRATEEAEAFMRVVKASEYKIVEQMAKSSAHFSLLALLLSSKPHREALLRVLTVAQVPKETPLDRIGETVSSIFYNSISFSDDELLFEGWAHSQALHTICKCNNYVIGRVMIDNGSALNVCPVTTLKQMNVDLNCICPSKTAVRAFDGSWREVNGEIDLLIDVGLYSFSVTFQKLKFIIGEKLITVKEEEDYTIYKETTVPYINIGDDENLPFHSFEIISVIRDNGEVGPTCADRMVGKILMCHNYIPSAGLGAHRQGISHPIEVEEYNHRRGLGIRPSCHEILEARRNKHLRYLASHDRQLNRGLLVPPLSYFFPGAPHIVENALDGPSSDSDDAPGMHVRGARCTRRATGVHGRRAGARVGARACRRTRGRVRVPGRARLCASGRVRVRGRARLCERGKCKSRDRPEGVDPYAEE